MEHEPLFENRVEAGQGLAKLLNQYAHRSPNAAAKDLPHSFQEALHPPLAAIVLGLPRGGIPIAYEIAAALGLPLDAFLVRKLGVPQHPELALGAISGEGKRYLNPRIMAEYAVDPVLLEQITQREWQELQRRNLQYRQGRPPPHLSGQVVIVVDDGIATGATMAVALESLKQYQPQQLVVAIPVAPFETYRMLQTIADEVICPFLPNPFHSVGEWYADFSQTSDAEVCRLLNQATD